MSSVDLATQVRQTLLVGFHGTDAAAAAPLVQRLRPGGLVVLPRNVQSAAQLADLTSDLQDVARAEGLPTLLFAADQEGGAVARLSSEAGFTDLPSAMAVGLAGDAAIARELAALTGRELAAVGINLDLTPVLDLALDPRNTVIGSRSYGKDPDTVSAFGQAVIYGLRSAGILACAKHFPGHGATAVDSHLDLPRLQASVQELEERDLVPFRGAIVAGCAAIMTAHVISRFDPALPATLSRITLTNVLRGRLDFRGLILTDALEMKALAGTRVPRWQTGAEALRAGADVLVFEGDTELIEDSVAWIERSLDRDELDPSVLDAASNHLAAARATVGAPSGQLGTIGSITHRSLAGRVASQGIGVSDVAGRLPFSEVPVVLDVGAGGKFASVVGWSLSSAEQSVAGTGSVTIVSEESELTSDLRALFQRLSQSGLQVVLVVLGGWQPPMNIPTDVIVVMAYDLPKGLWPLIAERLTRARQAAAPVAVKAE
jgi:beta-N-acetylhexosaminidase